MKHLTVGEIPAELLVKPSAFISFSGLDIDNNSVHKTIWESFTVNRPPERAPLLYKLLSETHLFPPMKQKRTSYEWYVPKGLLKTNWFNKHLNEVPALHILYVDLNWDHPQWNDAVHQCAQRVQALRSRLFGRTTRVALVLIQKSTNFPPGEDVIAAEHAATLCSLCDLTAKSLFVIPHSDHLPGYIARLEMAFIELVKAYYNHEARAVKAHQDFLSKTTHQLLFVRHQFKMGFLNELKQDPMVALKHYKQAYSNLMEVRVADTNMLEVKTVAGFINYKICKLCFFVNTPLEAISQFRKHIDTFKQKEGCNELLFEHSAWLSKQFENFGDLFDDAIKQGLAAIQTQHPGFYYQQAANHAMIRKECCYQLCKTVNTYPAEDPLSNEESMEFYGQRPWRPGSQSMEPPDPQKEKEGIIALKYREITSVNHSKLIIPLLSNAVNHYKKHRCPRMKKNLMVLMGEEYYHNQDYSRALVLLSKVSWHYRAERWWKLLTGIQQTALKCAYLSANIQGYISLALELTGEYHIISEVEKIRIQNNILNVLERKVPEPEPDCLERSVEKAKALWGKSLTECQAFNIEFNSLMPFVECKARFVEEQFYVDEPVILKVYLRFVNHIYVNDENYVLYSVTTCPLPIEFSKLNVCFTNKSSCHFGQSHMTYQADVDAVTFTKMAEASIDSSDEDIFQNYAGKKGIKPYRFESKRRRLNVDQPGNVGSRMYNDSCVVINDDNANNLRFSPKEVKTFTFSFYPHETDVGRDILISSVKLQLGTDPTHSAILFWNGGGSSVLPDSGFTSFHPQNVNVKNDFPSIDVRSNTKIFSRDPRVSIEINHEAPALQDEFYPIKIVIVNNEYSSMKNIKLYFKLIDNENQTLCNTSEYFHLRFLYVSILNSLKQDGRHSHVTFIATTCLRAEELGRYGFGRVVTHISSDMPNFVGTIVSDVGCISCLELACGEQIEKVMYLKLLSKDPRNFEVQVNYKLNVQVNNETLTCSFSKAESFSLQTVDPFDISFQIMDMKFGKLLKATSEEPFVLLSSIKCTSPWPIVIETSHLGLSQYANPLDGNIVSQLDGLNIKLDDVASECMCLVAPQPISSPATLGNYTLQWHRVTSDEKIPFVQTTVPLPSLIIHLGKIFIEANIPATGLVRAALPVCYTIYNRSENVQEIELFMDSHDGIMFSGHKQFHFRILPREAEKLNFNLYPLHCGKVSLPRLRIKLNPNSESSINFDDEAQKMIPSHIFVMPQGKHGTNVTENILVSQ
ncbi:Trafficking protein particle complex subunit 11 [Nymphon striatum]|nr:Trafficking protein particle complex subunit 11 [Nymphon striatum]